MKLPRACVTLLHLNVLQKVNVQEQVIIGVMIAATQVRVLVRQMFVVMDLVLVTRQPRVVLRTVDQNQQFVLQPMQTTLLVKLLVTQIHAQMVVSLIARAARFDVLTSVVTGHAMVLRAH